MRRPSTGELARLRFGVTGIAFVLALGACAAQKNDDRLDPLGLVPPPPTISAAEAGDHVGELVVVEARITSARVARGQAFLEPETDGPGGLVIAVAPPVVGPSARELAETYDGREVRAVGYISDLGDDLEMLIGDPARIRLAGVDASEAAEPEPAPAAAAPAVVEPAPASSPAPRPATDSPPVQAVAPASSEPDPACENARRAWRIAAADAKAPLRELLGCLEKGEPRCTAAAARARVALAEVAASEERVRWVCGGTS